MCNKALTIEEGTDLRSSDPPSGPEPGRPEDEEKVAVGMGERETIKARESGRGEREGRGLSLAPAAKELGVIVCSGTKEKDEREEEETGHAGQEGEGQEQEDD